jgi:mitochondrial import inner membrane translocase subunit TIM50
VPGDDSELKIPPESQPSRPDPPRRPQRRVPPPGAEAKEADVDVDVDADADPQPAQPLPDLTKGIPSTLDAELERAHSQGHASRSSLNITEDPSEPVHAEEGGSGDRFPRESYISSSDRKKSTVIKGTYLALGVAAISYALYLGRNWESEEEAKNYPDAPSGWGVGLFYDRVKARLFSTISYYNDPVTTKLLPDEEADPAFRMPFTLVLSLEDLLVHQEWTREKGWRIAKRPGLDYFLRYLSQYYELVLFTSQPSSMGDQVMRKLDPYMMVRWPLYREATLYKDGGYIKVSQSPVMLLVLLTDLHLGSLLPQP